MGDDYPPNGNTRKDRLVTVMVLVMVFMILIALRECIYVVVYLLIFRYPAVFGQYIYKYFLSHDSSIPLSSLSRRLSIVRIYEYNQGGYNYITYNLLLSTLRTKDKP